LGAAQRGIAANTAWREAALVVLPGAAAGAVWLMTAQWMRRTMPLEAGDQP
jgi:hypothetical protein